MTSDELEAKLEHANKDYASLLEACEADRQARLELVEECERLKAENEKLSDLKKVNSMLATANEMFSRSEAKYLEKIKQLEAERDEARKECERLKDEINHWKVKAECYGEMVHGCHPVFVRLGVLDENKRGSGAIANAAQKLATINNHIKAERDQWKRAANTLASDIKRLSVSAEMPQDAEIKEGRWQSVERELYDLQQRVAKLEQFHEAIVKPGTGFTVVTLPQDIEPLPAVTEATEKVFKVGDVVTPNEPIAYPLGQNAWRFKLGDVLIVKRVGANYISVHGDEHHDWLQKHFRHATPAERAAFFANNPTLHPAYTPEHGNMAGWTYLEVGQDIIPHEDEWWHDKLKRWLATNSDDSGPVLVYSSAIRRRVQAENEVV